MKKILAINLLLVLLSGCASISLEIVSNQEIGKQFKGKKFSSLASCQNLANKLNETKPVVSNVSSISNQGQQSEVFFYFYAYCE